MALEGYLRDLPLTDILQVFESGRKTGKMLFVRQPYKAVLWFRDGNVVNAVIIAHDVRKPIAAGETAIFEMMGWDDASFVFRGLHLDEHYPTNIQCSTEWLILEGLRHRNSKTQSVVQMYDRLTLQTCLRLVPNLSRYPHTSVSLSLEDWRILSHLCDDLTVQQLIEKTGVPYQQIAYIVSRLLAINLVEIVSQRVLPERKVLLAVPDAAGSHAMVRVPVGSLVQRIKRRLQALST